MKQSQLRNAVVSGTVDCALAVAIALRPEPPAPVYDDSGERLESLFAGIAPDAEAREAVVRDRSSSGGSLAPCQSTSRSYVISRVGSIRPWHLPIHVLPDAAGATFIASPALARRVATTWAGTTPSMSTRIARCGISVDRMPAALVATSAALAPRGLASTGTSTDVAEVSAEESSMESMASGP